LKPLISIIIPTYDRAQFLLETLWSIQSQSFKNWECIIVDDNSKDNTKQLVLDLIEKDIRFSYYSKPLYFPKGPNSCRNFGFTKSKGQWIQWFDSDDILKENALQEYQKFFNKNYDAVVAKLEKFDFDNNVKLGENKIISNTTITDYFVGEIAYYTCGPIWNRLFLEKQNYLFDENISNLDDWDFNLRMLYQNPKIYFLYKVLIQYRIHSKSLSHEILKFNRNELKSEIKTRKKHLLLIKKTAKIPIEDLKRFYHNRLKFLLRESLIKNDETRFYLLQEILKFQINFCYFMDLFKTIFGFCSFTLFNKGYKLLS
jgi:glycosyltransferase involved in cell wall biosynthesis